MVGLNGKGPYFEFFVGVKQAGSGIIVRSFK